MADSWCFTRDGRNTFGPVSWSELRRMALTGHLLRTDLVGGVGMRSPRKAVDVADLFPLHFGERTDISGGSSEQMTH